MQVFCEGPNRFASGKRKACRDVRDCIMYARVRCGWRTCAKWSSENVFPARLTSVKIGAGRGLPETRLSPFRSFGSETYNA